MPPNSERPEHLFVVRIWQESTQLKSSNWRGSIEHIPSGQRLYFTSLNDVSDFIRLRLAAPCQDAAQSADRNTGS